MKYKICGKAATFLIFIFIQFGMANAGAVENKILTNTILNSAWSAMDQSYPRDNTNSRLAEGTQLYSPDNVATSEANARKMPWDIPNNFIVKFDTGITNIGGRAIIYSDSTTPTIMVAFMGTNGNEDRKGWDANLRDMAGMQLIKYGDNRALEPLFSLERTVLDKVSELTIISRATGVSPNIIFVGDSKGGAQAQAMLASYVRSRDDFPVARAKAGIKHNPSAFVQNKNLALVAHSAPGALEPIRSKGYDVSPARYSNIEMHYSFAYNDYYSEIISSLGHYLGVSKDNPKALVFKYKTKYISPQAMHRIGISGYKYFEEGHDFADMTPSEKPVLLAKTQNLSDILMAIIDTISQRPIEN